MDVTFGEIPLGGYKFVCYTCLITIFSYLNLSYVNRVYEIREWVQANVMTK